MSSKPRARRGAENRPRLEALECRALLSGVVAAEMAPPGKEPLLTAIYEHELHREPTPRELNRAAQQLGSEMSPLAEARALLLSREYQSAHRGAEAFVEGLYHDVLGRDADPDGKAFWVGHLQQGQTNRAQLARTFLASNASFLEAPLIGSITGVSVNNGWSSGTRGNTLAFAAGTFNIGTPPTIITINVSAAGQYTLNQSNGSYIGNNSGRNWQGFTLTILSSSTARASFTSSSDATGRLPTVKVTATSVSFSGGTVTSGSNYLVNGFQPVTTFSTTRGGTIVIQETPVNS